MAEQKTLWYNENNFVNHYMSSVEKVREDKINFLGAVTHVDNTGRVQDVTKKLNPLYYKLIDKFYQKTNVPVLLNTSFNDKRTNRKISKRSYKLFVKNRFRLFIYK